MRVLESTSLSTIVVVLLCACVSSTPPPSAQAVPGASSPSASPSAALVSPSPRATITSPAASPDPPATEEPVESGAATPEPRPEVTLPPLAGTPRLAGVESAWRDGCGGLYDGTTEFGIDDCGPFDWTQFLASAPIRVVSGTRLVIRAPAGSTFSYVTAGLDAEWTVKIARPVELAGNPETLFFPDGVGAIVAHGRGPDAFIVITTPDRAGEYAVQLDAPLAAGNWTFTDGGWLWLVRVI